MHNILIQMKDMVLKDSDYARFWMELKLSAGKIYCMVETVPGHMDITDIIYAYII